MRAKTNLINRKKLINNKNINKIKRWKSVNYCLRRSKQKKNNKSQEKIVNMNNIRVKKSEVKKEKVE